LILDFIFTPGIRSVATYGAAVFWELEYGQINFFIDTYFANASIMPREALTALYVVGPSDELCAGRVRACGGLRPFCR